MKPTHPRVTPTDLGDHPQLAVLELLGDTLHIVKLALIAAHPDLADADPAAVPSDLQVLAADHVLIGADALQRLVASYRTTLGAELHCVQRPGPDDDVEF